MDDKELYDATRGWWYRIREKCSKCKYILSVRDDLVLEVYEVIKWLDEGVRTFNCVHDENEWISNSDERREFVGKIAEDSIRKKYINKSIKKIKKRSERPYVIEKKIIESEEN